MPGQAEDLLLECSVVDRVENAAPIELWSWALEPGHDALGGPASAQQCDQSCHQYQAPVWLHGNGAREDALDRALAGAKQVSQVTTAYAWQNRFQFSQK